jgi:predicted transcriptional regulator
MLISQIYKDTPYFVSEDETIKEALAQIVDQHFNGVIVRNSKNHITGVLSIQDIAAATVPVEFTNNVSLASATYKEGFFQEIAKEIGNKKVKDIMRTEYIHVTPKSNIMEVAADFLQKDLYLVPVIEKDKVIGVITRSEIKQALAQSMGVSAMQ